MDCPSCSSSLTIWLSGADRKTAQGFYCTKEKKHFPVERKGEAQKMQQDEQKKDTERKEIVVPEGKFLKEEKKTWWKKIVQFFASKVF